MFFLKNCDLLHPAEIFSKKKNLAALLYTLFNLDPSTSIKLNIGYGMFPSVIQGMGTARHFKFLEQLMAGEVGPDLNQNRDSILINTICY